MSPAFIAGVETSLPKAKITFDRFHIMQLMSQAVDAIRREEVKNPALPGGACEGYSSSTK